LLRRMPVAALVPVFASMDDSGNPADAQLTRFLTASEPLPRYVGSLRLVAARPGG